jgi:hypothetical protein
MSLNNLVPAFVQALKQLHDALLPVCLLLGFAGLLYNTFSLYREKTVASLMPYLVKMFIAFSLLGSLATWGDNLQGGIQGLMGQLKLNENVLQELSQAYADKFGVSISTTGQSQAQNSAPNFWQQAVGAIEKAFNFVAGGSDTVVEGFFSVLIIFFAMLGLILMWLMSLVQQVFVATCIGVSPIFLGCLLVPPLGNLAARFLTNYIGFLLWPLGWGLANIITKLLIGFATNPNGNPAIAGVNFFGGGIFWWVALCFWTIFSAIMAPWIVSKAMTAGQNPFVALFSSGLSTGVVVAQSFANVATSAATAPATGGTSLVAGGASAASTTLGQAKSFASRPRKT